jgi:hypothetical protein
MPLYLTICANGAGISNIGFPDTCDVFDPFTNDKIYENVTQFTRDFQEKEVLIMLYIPMRQENEY